MSSFLIILVMAYPEEGLQNASYMLMARSVIRLLQTSCKNLFLTNLWMTIKVIRFNERIINVNFIIELCSNCKSDY